MPEGRMRQILSILSCVFLVSCGSDRTAGGTTGTEAGNALAITLSLPGGAPAARASVVLRPSDATDASGASEWIRGTADENGRVDLRFGEGSWTMEARSDSFALVADVSGGSDVSFFGGLLGVRTLRGTVLGASEGRLALPGLGRSVALAADGSFRIDSLPAQTLRLRIDGVAGWTSPSDTGAFILSASDPGAVYLAPVRLAIAGDGVAGPRLVADSLVPENAVFLDTLGNILSLRRGGVSSGLRRLWARVPVGVRSVILCRRVPPAIGMSDSVFRRVDGSRLEIIPDLDSSLADLSATGGGFLAAGVLATDSAWGSVLDASLGGSIGTIQAGLPDTGRFAILYLARLRTAGIESLWLLDWTDSLGAGMRVGVGGKRLVFEGAGFDTSVVWDPGASWFGLAVSWDGSTLSISCDGTTRMRLPVASPVFANRSSWSRREVGLGGGLRLARLSVHSGLFDSDVLSAPAAVLPRID